MPAALPGDSNANNTGANPSAGRAVAFDLLSGPKGSPFDRAGSSAASTGGLSTGIGCNPLVTWENPTNLYPYIATARHRGFDSNTIFGLTKPDGTTMNNSCLMYIGGGKMANGSTPVAVRAPIPYTAGYGIGAAGNGGARDAGVGPTVFTGFNMSLVTGSSIANGSVLSSTYVNRSGVTTLVGSAGTIGVNNAASAAVA